MLVWMDAWRRVLVDSRRFKIDVLTHLRRMAVPKQTLDVAPKFLRESEEGYYSITMKVELVTTLKHHATELLKELREEKEPILITEHGRPSAYLIDVDHFEYIQKKLTLLEGLARGEKAILDDHVVSQEDAKKRMARWLT